MLKSIFLMLSLFFTFSSTHVNADLFKDLVKSVETNFENATNDLARVRKKTVDPIITNAENAGNDLARARQKAVDPIIINAENAGNDLARARGEIVESLKTNAENLGIYLARLRQGLIGHSKESEEEANRLQRTLWHPSCPLNNPSTTWKDYMSGVIPRTHNKRSAMASIHFTKAKLINDSKAIGNLRTDFCYTSYYNYNPAETTEKLGYFSYHHYKDGTATKSGLPGNPSEYEINVFGVILLFNEYGEVLNKKGQIVGELVCYGAYRKQCEKF